ncbi:MFS transporter [Arthrobacter sp. S2(2024)]|uniref:MFS transporter n=1 Tax=Arthrobacter sp. S2(2024) TaxID=3111911 RepID=UPI002FCB14EB
MIDRSETTVVVAAEQNISTTRSNKRALLALGLGNTMEQYDWIIFGLLASFIGPQFFPSHDPLAATMNALIIFAVGFAMRPVGGVILGFVADRFGRRRVLLWSFTLMALMTLVIGITPSYAAIGPWASIILCACRVIQGISAGVEIPLVTSYAVELTPKGNEGRTGGYMSFYVNLGILLASLVSFFNSLFLSEEVMNSWGWRIPFLVGALLGAVVIFLRRSLPESLVEADRQTTPQIWSGVRRAWMGVLAIVFVVGAVQAYIYAWNVGLPNLARGTYRENPTMVFAVTTVLSVLLLVASPICGKLADRFKLSRVFIWTRLLAIPSVFLMLLYTAQGMGTFIAVVFGGAVMLALNSTIYNVVATSLLPKACRGTGVALGYGIGVALFGGTASYLLLWLRDNNMIWMFPVYISVLSLISVLLYIIVRRKGGIYAGE